MKRLMLAAVAALMIGVPATASADTVSGYACSVSHYPWTSYGEAGRILVATYANPDCTGFIAYTQMCSKGATAGSCTSSSAYKPSAIMFAALYQNLQRAAESRQPVSVVTDSGDKYKGRLVLFN